MRGASGRRAIGLLTLLASIIMLGAATSTWAQILIEEPFGDGLVETIEPIAGPAQAGWLTGAALGCMLLAGFVIRWTRTAIAMALSGAVIAGGIAWSWPDTGEATAAPGIALAMALAVAGMGTFVILRASRFDDDSDERPQRPSRYTVEAAASRTGGAPGPDGAAEDLDEWDAAVASDDERA